MGLWQIHPLRIYLWSFSSARATNIQALEWKSKYVFGTGLVVQCIRLFHFFRGTWHSAVVMGYTEGHTLHQRYSATGLFGLCWVELPTSPHEIIHRQNVQECSPCYLHHLIQSGNTCAGKKLRAAEDGSTCIVEEHWVVSDPGIASDTIEFCKHASYFGKTAS